MKMIMKQIEMLSLRGHDVEAVYRGDAGTPVLPPWASSTPVSRTRLLRRDESVMSCCDGSDLIVIGYVTQLLEFTDVTDSPGPVVYWDQGHEHVFGDPTGDAFWDNFFHVSMYVVVPMYIWGGGATTAVATGHSRVVVVLTASQNVINESMSWRIVKPCSLLKCGVRCVTVWRVWTLQALAHRPAVGGRRYPRRAVVALLPRYTCHSQRHRLHPIHCQSQPARGIDRRPQGTRTSCPNRRPPRPTAEELQRRAPGNDAEVEEDEELA